MIQADSQSFGDNRRIECDAGKRSKNDYKLHAFYKSNADSHEDGVHVKIEIVFEVLVQKENIYSRSVSDSACLYTYKTYNWLRLQPRNVVT